MSAERGWIGQPQPQRTSIPGEERKWHIMMGATSKDGYETREAQEAHRRYQEGTYDGAHQHVAGYERSHDD